MKIQEWNISKPKILSFQIHTTTSNPAKARTRARGKLQSKCHSVKRIQVFRFHIKGNVCLYTLQGRRTRPRATTSIESLWVDCTYFRGNTFVISRTRSSILYGAEEKARKEGLKICKLQILEVYPWEWKIKMMLRLVNFWILEPCLDWCQVILGRGELL